MSRSLTTRLAALPLLRSSCTRGARFFSQTSTRRNESGDDEPKRVQARPQTESLLHSMYGPPQSGREARQPNAMADLSQKVASISEDMVLRALNRKIDTSALSGTPAPASEAQENEPEPYHFHIYSHKHNTHITCTKPNREPIISMSCGNIGYRKSRRGTFDSAYSLTKYVLERLIHTGWPMKMKRMELVLRGFGQGREAAVKVLMSPEGKLFRDKIVRVADSTRIKFGGTRSEKPRRL